MIQEDGTDVRLTEKNGSLHIILMQRPRGRKVSIAYMHAKVWGEDHLLGFQNALP